jgi:hypothetical protein
VEYPAIADVVLEDIARVLSVDDPVKCRCNLTALRKTVLLPVSFKVPILWPVTVCRSV